MLDVIERTQLGRITVMRSEDHVLADMAFWGRYDPANEFT